MKCAASFPLLLKHLKILCSVPTLVWTSGQITLIGMCGVPPLLLKYLRMLCGVPTLHGTSDQYDKQKTKVCVVSPPSSIPFSVQFSHLFATFGSVLDSKQSWESGKFQLARWSNRSFFCVLLGPSWIINLAQLVSPSVALPAELVIALFLIRKWICFVLRRSSKNGHNFWAIAFVGFWNFKGLIKYCTITVIYFKFQPFLSNQHTTACF